MTPDGESYAYSHIRRINDLYLTSPLGGGGGELGGGDDGAPRRASTSPFPGAID